MNISHFGDKKSNKALEQSLNQTDQIDIEKEENGDEGFDSVKYQYLNQATSYTMNQLKSDKEDSFIKSTKAHATIINYLGLFKGMFTRKSLEVYYYEALFILEQDYEDLKKTMMMNEVFSLGISLIQNEMFPSDMFMPNIFGILFKTIIDVIQGKEKIVYPEKQIMKFQKVLILCLDKDKLTQIDSVEQFKEFFQKLIENLDKVAESTINEFASIYLDYAWSCSSQFNNYLAQKEEGDQKIKEWLVPNNKILETLLSKI